MEEMEFVSALILGTDGSQTKVYLPENWDAAKEMLGITTMDCTAIDTGVVALYDIVDKWRQSVRCVTDFTLCGIPCYMPDRAVLVGFCMDGDDIVLANIPPNSIRINDERGNLTPLKVFSDEELARNGCYVG